MLDPGQIAIMIPIIALMIPIVAILTAHQRRMAEIIHSSRSQQSEAELAAIREEVRALRELVHQQVIALDRTGGLPPAAITPPAVPSGQPESVAVRLGG